MLLAFQASGVAWAEDLPAGLGSILPQTETISTEIDLEPPSIDHESLEDGVAGEAQTFSALVRDDRGVESVSFHYRQASGGDFATVPMRPVPGTGNYVVTIETGIQHERVNYYIEARDTGGNRVLKGFPFRPLERQLKAPVIQEPVLATDVQPKRQSRRSWIFVALGLVAVGVLVAASDSGSSSESPLVPLTVTATQP